MATPTQATQINERPRDPMLAAEWDFLNKLGAASPADIASLWKESGPTDHGRRRLILERWVQLDPNEAASAVRGDYWLCPFVYDAWFKRDPEAAKVAAKLEEGEAHFLAFRGILSAAQNDPKIFFRLLKEEPDTAAKAFYDGVSNKGLRGLLAYSRKDLLDFSEKLDDSIRAQIESVLVEMLAETDMEKAIAHVEAAENSRLAHATATAVMPRLMEQDWMKAGEVLSKLESKEETSGLAWSLLPKLREQLAVDSGQVIDWINANLAKCEWTRRSLLFSLSSEFLATQPEVALRLGEHASIESLPSIFRSFPPGEPATLLAATAKVPASAYRDWVLDQSLRQWQVSDPAAAQAWVAGLEEGAFKSRAQVALDHVGEDGINGLFAGALESLRQHPNDKGFQTTLTTTAVEMARFDPAFALAKVADLPPGNLRESAMANVASSAAAVTSPHTVLTWVADLPDEADQLSAIPAVTKVWTKDDPPAVSQWLALQPPGPIRDRAVAAFVENVWQVEPEAAVQWAATLTVGPQRTKTLENILPGVLKRDRATALVLLENAALTPQERAHWSTYNPPHTPSK